MDQRNWDGRMTDRHMWNLEARMDAHSKATSMLNVRYSAC